MPMNDKDPSLSPVFVNSVAKAFRVLGAFEGERQLSLTRIARRLDIPVSAAQRFLYTLQQLGYVTKDNNTRTYELSARVLRLASAYLRTNELVRRAGPYMGELNQMIGETINLSVLDDVHIIIIARLPSRFLTDPQVTIGSQMPAFCTASGLAILAQLSAEEAEAIVNRSDRKQYTPRTETDAARIMERLQLCRSRGYSFTNEESFLGDMTISSALMSAGRPVAALTVAVPTARWTAEDAEARLAPALISAARAMSGIL